jgi:hypothetical protein
VGYRCRAEDLHRIEGRSDWNLEIGLVHSLNELG